MRIIGIGERKVFFAKVQEDNGNEAEIALDPSGYTLLRQMLLPGLGEVHLREHTTEQRMTPQEAGVAHSFMEELSQGLDGGNGAPKPVSDMPDDLKQKLASIGVTEDVEPDPGEVYQDAGDDLDDSEQV